MVHAVFPSLISLGNPFKRYFGFRHNIFSSTASILGYFGLTGDFWECTVEKRLCGFC
jgi:hypothetical protein